MESMTWWLIYAGLAYGLYRLAQGLVRRLAASRRQGDDPLAELAALGLELERNRERLSPQRCAQLQDRLDTELREALALRGAPPGSKRRKALRERGWQRLGLAGPPPWRIPPIQPHAVVPVSTCDREERSAPPTDKSSSGAAPSPFSAFRQAQAPLPKAKAAATGAGKGSSSAEQAPSPIPTAATAPSHTQARSSSAGDRDFGLAPSPPGALERTLHALSGWPRALAPFLVQNIGYFVGGFLFVAGSVFLVSYTAGFGRGVTVLAVLTGYTLLLVAGGYVLRRKRPDLVLAGGVLMSLGLLLMPLDTATAVRLILGAQGPLQTALGWLMAAVLLLLLGIAARLVSGVMERTLGDGHARLYLALSALQLALPLLPGSVSLAQSAGWLPDWWLLALLHLLLLGLLGVGLIRFGETWIGRIFVDRDKLVGFAAGTLVYAALVSFVHLTRGAPLALPAGYYAPFLMLATGLLFHLDDRLRVHALARPYLSRLHYLLYGLSIVALLLGLDNYPARLITLAAAVAVYARVTRGTLSPLPAALLCTALVWLYGEVVLAWLAPRWHFLLALPGLAVLARGECWLRRRGARRLARRLYALLLSGLPGLCLWSLWHAGPGWLAVGCALLAVALLEPLLASAPALDDRPQDLRNGPAVYLQTSLLVLAAAMAAPSDAELVIGLSLLPAALVLTWLGLGAARGRGRSIPRIGRAEALLNSALATMALATALTWLNLASAITPETPEVIAAALGTALAGALLLGIGMALCRRPPVYAALVLWALAGTAFKLFLFPGPTRGGLVLCFAAAAWLLAWWVSRRPPRPLTPSPVRLLGLPARLPATAH
jgi:hypothetical protein